LRKIRFSANFVKFYISSVSAGISSVSVPYQLRISPASAPYHCRISPVSTKPQ